MAWIRVCVVGGLAIGAVAAGCWSEAPAPHEPQGRAQQASKPPPPPPPPDLSGVGVNCSTGGIGNPALAKQVYDQYFASRFPANYEALEMAPQPTLASPEIVKKVAFFNLPAGWSDDKYHQYYSFDPGSFQRPAAAGQKNFDVFSAFDPKTDLEAPYLRFNPDDYIPVTYTYYNRTDDHDIMANQFVYRYACFPSYAAALDACPDCSDAITFFSKYDLDRVFEVRYGRIVNGTIHLSRPFKVISSDTSGNMASHTQTAPYLYGTVNGETLRALWRAEMSGKMYQLLGKGSGPVPGLARAFSSGGQGGSGQGGSGPGPTCAQLAQQNGWPNGAYSCHAAFCAGDALAASDCSTCCRASCGDLAKSYGEPSATCDSGEGTCAGQGVVTKDCSGGCCGAKIPTLPGGGQGGSAGQAGAGQGGGSGEGGSSAAAGTTGEAGGPGQGGSAPTAGQGGAGQAAGGAGQGGGAGAPVGGASAGGNAASAGSRQEGGQAQAGGAGQGGSGGKASEGVTVSNNGDAESEGSCAVASSGATAPGAAWLLGALGALLGLPLRRRRPEPRAGRPRA